MGYIRGDGRSQGILFPVVLDDLVPADHVCRVIDAFVDKLAMKELGFERAEAADTGRPGYDPRDMLKLYLYGYLNQIRSSRRLEQECLRNVELMWLLGRLYPDHKSIAEFRRMHREAITAAGARLVGFAKQCGLIRGEWIAIDGSKFRAVSSIDTVRERIQLQRYLDSMEQSEAEQQESIDSSAVETALQKLNQHPEPDAGFMLMRSSTAPAFNMQSAVDSKHAIIVAHEVVLDAADSRCLQPMAEAAKAALGIETFRIIADAGYSNGERAANCEAAGMLPHVPAARTVNTRSGGTLFTSRDFRYQPASDTYICLGDKSLRRKAVHHKDKYTVYEASGSDCGGCALREKCTKATKRTVSRHLYEEALERMTERVTPSLMGLRRSIVEHPFSTNKYRIFGHPRLLLRGRSGASIEIGLAVMAYNIKRMAKVLGAGILTEAIQQS